MKAIGTLAIVGLLLLISGFQFGVVGSQVLGLMGLTCLWFAFWRGLAKGLATGLAVLCGFAGLVLFGYSILAIYPAQFSGTVYLAASAALFILAITLGIIAYTKERAMSHESSVPQR